MDLWTGMNPQNAEKVVALLKGFGFDAPDLSKEVFVKPNQIIRRGVPPVRIEIMTTISGVSFEECYPERVKDELDGVEVNLISLRHLKINKKAFGRHKDLENLP